MRLTVARPVEPTPRERRPAMPARPCTCCHPAAMPRQCWRRQAQRPCRGAGRRPHTRMPFASAPHLGNPCCAQVHFQVRCGGHAPTSHRSNHPHARPAARPQPADGPHAHGDDGQGGASSQEQGGGGGGQLRPRRGVASHAGIPRAKACVLQGWAVAGPVHCGAPIINLLRRRLTLTPASSYATRCWPSTASRTGTKAAMSPGPSPLRWTPRATRVPATATWTLCEQGRAAARLALGWLTIGRRRRRQHVLLSLSARASVQLRRVAAWRPRRAGQLPVGRRCAAADG